MPATSKESYPVAWKTPTDAQAWAISNGHCTNEFEVMQTSFKNSLDVTGQDRIVGLESFSGGA